MKKRQSRPMSANSRIWTATGNVWPPFSIDMIIEGAGDITADQLQEAVTRASEANPGARLVSRGVLGLSRWVDSGRAPEVVVADGSGWSANGPDCAPFLMRKLDPRSGPTCEVLFIKGKPLRLGFRAHHAVMDGRGLVTWVEDIFRALRGEEPLGSDYCAIEDDLLNLSSFDSQSSSEKYIGPTGLPGKGQGFTWRRRRVNKKVQLLIPKTMCHFAREAHKFGQEKILIAMPVDLRQRRPGFRSTSNLSNAMFFTVGPGDNPEDLQNEIKKRLDEQIDGTRSWEDRIINHIPLVILEKIILRDSAASLKTGRYRFPVIISNMGRYETPPFSAPDFKAESIFMIPPGNELIPCFMGFVGSPDGFDIMMSLPMAYGGEGRIDAIMERLAAALEE